MMMISRWALRSLTPAMLLTSTRCLSTTTPQSLTIPPETQTAISGLEPLSLWSHFAAISSIPRPSKKETAVLSYIRDIAQSTGLEWKEDRAGNLCVFRPGSGGGEDAPPVILQGHVDMVTEKNQETKHNFDTDPIRLKTIGDTTWISAHGTTLGADNGIGVAAALVLLSAPPDHPRSMPPIEALFTVDEETGLNGAMELDAKALGLTGRTMLNLDTEEWGDLYVGCAGGGEMELTLPLHRNPEKGGTLVEVRVDGLLGGHSGINIHEGRANAVLICAAAARAAMDSGEGVKLVSIQGGDKHNAIPREASALLRVEESERSVVEAAVSKCLAAAKAEYGTLETGLDIRLSDAIPTEEHPLKKKSAETLLATISSIPIGPLKYSHVLPDLVETSNNLASVTCGAGEASILCSTRSSIDSALESTRDRIQSVATLAGASVKRSSPYPGWAPNPNSAVLGVAQRLLRNKLGREAGVKAIHAGLECGLLLEKLGSSENGEVVDALSFGPTITGAHSPDERIDAATVPPFFELVEDILAELAEKRKV